MMGHSHIWRVGVRAVLHGAMWLVTACLGLSPSTARCAGDEKLDFLVQQSLSGTTSENPEDFGVKIVSVYAENWSGKDYGGTIDAANITLNGADTASARGSTCWYMQSSGIGWFQFRWDGIFDPAVNCPRDISDYGLVTRLRFTARADVAGTQVRVNVFRKWDHGTEASELFTLGTSYAPYSVSMGNLRPQDFSALQFVVPSGGTVRLDDIRFNTGGYDPQRLVHSYRPLERELPENLTRFSNQSYLYDNALAIKTFVASRNPGYRQLAENIATTLLATAPNGLSGYFNERVCGNAFTVGNIVRGPLNQRRTLGDNAWFGLSLMDLYKLTGNTTYLTRAREISDWAETNLKNTTSPLKGYRGGYDYDGNTMLWRATEPNAAHFQLNRLLATELAARGDPAAGQYAARARYAGDFVMAMYDSANGPFYTGTIEDSDVINTSSIPVDAQLWTSLAMSKSAEYRDAIDWRRPVAWAEANLIRTDGAFTGFTYSSTSTANKVWFEGVASGAAVYTLLGEQAKADACMGTLEQARTTHPNADGAGVVAVSSDSLEDPVLKNWYYARLGVNATAWSYLVQNDINPFDVVVNGANQWASAGGGAWGETANWTQASVPDGNSEKVRLWSRLGSGAAIDLQGTDRRAKVLSFDNSLASYMVHSSGGGRLILSADSGPAMIRAEQGNARDHAIAAPMLLESAAEVTFRDRTLTLSGQQDWSGKTLTVKSGIVRYESNVPGKNTLGAALAIESGATVELAGAASALSDGTEHVDITNNSSTSGLTVLAGVQAVGGIDGGGTTTIEAGAELTASYVRQHSVILQGAAGNPARLIIRPSGSGGRLRLAPESLDALSSAASPSHPVPEPGTLLLVVAVAALWLCGFVGRAWRK